MRFLNVEFVIINKYKYSIFLLALLTLTDFSNIKGILMSNYLQKVNRTINQSVELNKIHRKATKNDPKSLNHSFEILI